MNYKNKWIPKEALRLLQAEQGRILDVGGGAAPYFGAAHIVDIQPYDAARLAGNAWPQPSSEKYKVQGAKTEDRRLKTEDPGRRDEGVGEDYRPKEGEASGHPPSSDYGAVSAALRGDRQMGNSKTFNLQPGTFNYEPRWSNSDYTQIDLCGCERMPFADDSYDLGLCSHVLEDLRDPVGVIREVFRVCRKVMVLGPSRLLEQTKGIEHPRYAGFYHHLWMMYEKDGQLVFRRKTPVMNLTGCSVPCPLFKTVTREAGSFMYIGEKASASEQMLWSETADAEEYRSFVGKVRSMNAVFEFDSQWKRPRYIVWKLRQRLFGVE